MKEKDKDYKNDRMGAGVFVDRDAMSARIRILPDQCGLDGRCAELPDRIAEGFHVPSG